MNVPDVILVKEKLLKETQNLISEVKADIIKLPTPNVEKDSLKSEKFGHVESKNSFAITEDFYKRRIFTDSRLDNQRYDVRALNEIVEKNQNRKYVHNKAINDTIGWQKLKYKPKIVDGKATSVDGVLHRFTFIMEQDD